MSIESISSCGRTPPLRLVQPASESDGAPGVSRSASAEPRSRAERSDSLSFDSLYVSRLPRVPYTEAQHRLERVRNELVAARVDLPIHFDRAPAVVTGAAAAYAKFTPAPADVNESATERAVEG